MAAVTMAEWWILAGFAVASYVVIHVVVALIRRSEKKYQDWRERW